MQGEAIENAADAGRGAGRGEVLRRLERNHFGLSVPRELRDDREVLAAGGVEADVNANRADRRVVAHAEAGSDRAGSANEILERAHAGQLIEDALADRPAVHEHAAPKVLQ